MGVTLESLLRGEHTLQQAWERVERHLSGLPSTLEVDLDAVAGMPASAATPSGFSPQELRGLVHVLASRLDVRALHVCEGTPGEGDAAGVGKLAALVVCDFVKARPDRAS
jgi:formiminoglutamase